MMSILTIRRESDIAIVTIDNPPVNALSQALRQVLWDAVTELDADDSVKGVLLCCAGRTFIAGADVSEFSKPPVEPHLPDLVSHIEAAQKPWAAAIQGTALGGGFEIALGCRFRIAQSSAKIGLPEVTLGLIPGASGTVRTPRLCGIETAIELITSGKPISAKKAEGLGLLDHIIEDDLVSEGVAFLRSALAQDLPQPLSARSIEQKDDAFWDEASDSVKKKAKGEAAPLAALNSIRSASELTFAEAMKAERETFLSLRASEQASALRHVFFAERAAPRPSHLKDVMPASVKSVAVIGGGTMGQGIAAALRDDCYPVILIERDEASLNRASDGLKAIFAGGVKRGKLTEQQAVERHAGIHFSDDYSQLKDVDLVIEAVFEDLSVKRDVFAKLDAVCRKETILATNTSYLDPSKITEGLDHQERFIGLHFFSPANVMKLLEIIPLKDTSPVALATGFGLARALGKVPVEAGICDGFIGNRILKRYRMAAEALVVKGIKIDAIDAAMRSYGFAMGPFEAQDLGGLDIAYLQREGARSEGKHIAKTLGDILVKAGRKGQKTGAGWYDYQEGNRKPIPSTTVQDLLASKVSGTIALNTEEIASQLVGEMAAEGQAILDEGIARSTSDIDLVKIHGYGFPRWRGGPMFATRK
jgi:3-hydroxyacyl-CoA dehydrogenase